MKVCSNALRFNPFKIDLWLSAVYYQFEIEKNPFSARKMMFKALKFNKNELKIWSEYIKFEVAYLDLVHQRQVQLQKREPTNQNEMEEEKNPQNQQNDAENYPNSLDNPQIISVNQKDQPIKSSSKQKQEATADFIGFDLEEEVQEAEKIIRIDSTSSTEIVLTLRQGDHFKHT